MADSSQLKKYPFLNADDVQEKYRNQVLVCTTFQLKDKNVKKDVLENQILLKQFVWETYNEDKKVEQDYRLDTIYYHMLKSYYKMDLPDSYCLMTFQLENQDKDWDQRPKDELIYAKYHLERSVGCSHFVRGCKSQCSECKEFFVCRYCHDEVSDHKMNKLTEKGSCGIGTQSKPMFHCHGCKSCMTGFREHYFHCDKCSSCIRKDAEVHLCVKATGNCAVCLMTMEDSIYQNITLGCQHVIHNHCYQGIIQQGNLTCPICRKFAPPNEDREFYLKIIQKMYQEHLCRVNCPIINVQCNDCGLVQPHYATQQFYQCSKCDTFNCQPLNEYVSLEELNDFIHQNPRKFCLNLMDENGVKNVLKMKYNKNFEDLQEFVVVDDWTIIGEMINSCKRYEELVEMLTDE